MARNFAGDAGNSRIDFGSNNDQVNTFTFSILAKFDAMGDQDRLINKGTTLAGFKFLAMWHPDGPSNSIRGWVGYNTTNADSRTTLNSITTGTWYSFQMTFSDAGDKKVRIYMNGSEMSYDSQTAGVGTITNDSAASWRVGALQIDDILVLDGQLAEFAMWDEVLSASEIAGLGNFYSPLFFSPENLTHYSPLVGKVSPELELINGFTGTINGSVVANHPRIFYPTTAQISGFAVVAPEGVRRYYSPGIWRTV